MKKPEGDTVGAVVCVSVATGEFDDSVDGEVVIVADVYPDCVRVGIDEGDTNELDDIYADDDTEGDLDELIELYPEDETVYEI